MSASPSQGCLSELYTCHHLQTFRSSNRWRLGHQKILGFGWFSKHCFGYSGTKYTFTLMLRLYPFPKLQLCQPQSITVLFKTQVHFVKNWPLSYNTYFLIFWSHGIEKLFWKPGKCQWSAIVQTSILGLSVSLFSHFSDTD